MSNKIYQLLKLELNECLLLFINNYCHSDKEIILPEFSGILFCNFFLTN